MPCYLRSSFKSLPSSKGASLKIALDRADAARRVLFAPAAVVIGLVPVGSAASREGEGATSLERPTSYASVASLPADPPLSDWGHTGPD